MATVRSCRIACIALGTVAVASVAAAIWSVVQIDRIRSSADQSTRIEVVEQEGILDIGGSGYPHGSGSPVQQGFVTFTRPFDSPPVVTITEQVPPFLYKNAAQEEKGMCFVPNLPRLYRDRLAAYEEQSKLVGGLFEVKQSGNGQGFSWTYSYTGYIKSPEIQLCPEDRSPQVVRWKARGIIVVPNSRSER